MSEINVGKEVISYCNKCKLSLAHIIVNMKNDTKIGKVECKTCNAVHAYKDPSKVKAKASVKKTVRSKKTAASISDIWTEAISKATRKSQDYSTKTPFILGDIIDHPKFGPGVVDRLIDNNKIQVIFRHEIKTLMHNL